MKLVSIDPEVYVGDNEIKVKFSAYGQTIFVIKLESNGLEISGSYISQSGPVESSIGMSVIDRNTIRVDTT